jgi:SAM-dependent methyltransferase
MSAYHDKSALEQVYAARNADELAQAYAAWANAYDRETAASGYCLPFMIASWVARHVSRDVGALLDAGCGTGLSGPYLRALGYTNIDGLDFSEEMLALAAARGAYRELRRATLGKTLPWPDNHFAAFFSTGVFTEGHAPCDLHGPRHGFAERRIPRAILCLGKGGPLAASRGEPAFPRLRGGRAGSAGAGVRI